MALMNRVVEAHDDSDRPSLTPKLLSCFQLIFPVSEETLIRGQREGERESNAYFTGLFRRKMGFWC